MLLILMLSILMVDIHKLRNGKYLSLAGLKIKSKYEARSFRWRCRITFIIDALLSSINKGDIDALSALNKYKNISSIKLLEETMKKLK